MIAYLVGRVSRVRNLGKPRNAVWLFDPRTRRRRLFASPRVGYTIRGDRLVGPGRARGVRDPQGVRPSAKVTIYSRAGRRLLRFDVAGQHHLCGVTWSRDGGRLLLTMVPASSAALTVDPNGEHRRHLSVGLGLTSCDVSWR